MHCAQLRLSLLPFFFVDCCPEPQIRNCGVKQFVMMALWHSGAAASIGQHTVHRPPLSQEDADREEYAM